VDITFKLPDILLSPSLQDIQAKLSEVVKLIMEVPLNVKWWEESHRGTMYRKLTNDDSLLTTKTKLDEVILSKLTVNFRFCIMFPIGFYFSLV